MHWLNGTYSCLCIFIRRLRDVLTLPRVVGVVVIAGLCGITAETADLLLRKNGYPNSSVPNI